MIRRHEGERHTIIFYGNGPDYWQPFIDEAVAKLVSEGNRIVEIEISNPNPLRLQHQPIHHADIYYLPS